MNIDIDFTKIQFEVAGKTAELSWVEDECVETYTVSSLHLRSDGKWVATRNFISTDGWDTSREGISNSIEGAIKNLAKAMKQETYTVED